MGEIPEFNFDDFGDSGNDLEEHSFEFSGDEFSFTVADVRNAMQVKKELKEAQTDLAAVKKENAEYKKMLEELREERDLEYNARRTAKNKCYWLKQMYGGLVEFMLDLLGCLETEKKGRRRRGGVLKTGDLKMLKRVPAQLKPLIGRLEDAKVKEDFRGFDMALEKVMKSARDLQTKLRGGEDPEDNAGTVGDGGSGWNDLVEPTVIPIAVPVSTEVEVDPDVDVVPIETVDGEQEVLPPKTRHAVNPKNSRECLCGYTSSISTNVLSHVRRLTTDRKKRKGAFVCHICGDRLTGRTVLRGHVACHKSPKSVPIATAQPNIDCSEDGRQVESAMMSEGQSPSNKVTKSRPEVTSSSSSAKTPESQVEMMDQRMTVPVSTEVGVDPVVVVVPMETLDGEQEVLPPKTRHAVNPKNSRECLCGYTSKTSKVKIHVQRVTIDLKNARGRFVCPVCGDKLASKAMLRRHLVCHKSSKPVPIAPVQSNGSSENGQLVGSAMMSGDQSPTNKVTKSGPEMTSPSSSSAKTPEPQVEMDQEDDQANATDLRTLRSATSPKRKHHRCPGNPHRCSCGFTSKKVRHHIWRVTVGKQSISGAHICKLCGDRFRHRYSLNRHMARHLISPLPTPKAGLRKAIPVVVQTEADEDEVDGEMPVLTQQCPASWITQDVTPAPTTTTDVQEDTSSVPLVRSPNKYTNVKCPSCGQRFPFRCHLWKHCMQVHNVRIPASTPPHECHLCKKSFNKYADYFNHHFTAHLDSMEKKI